ncbi:MAG: TatD family hydrolase [Victivallales bacterium]|nr:TatD family hydrolase [Victivallales bacterium]
MFFDIHKHTENLDREYKNALINIFPGQLDKISRNSNTYFSICCHPYYVNTLPDFDKLEKYLTRQNVLAVGEVGLDRLSQDFEKQKDIFEKMLFLAGKYNKAVIIHCVKAFSEILHLRKKYTETSWIIHGFRGKLQLAEQLISHNIYVSFGSSLVNPPDKITETVKNISCEKIFFETDETDINIDNIYRNFANIRNISLNELCDRVYKNLTMVFGEIKCSEH